MNIGFIKISRSLFDHFLWKENRVYSRAEAWIDLIRTASYRPEDHFCQSGCLSLNTGELAASVRYLAQRWSWSKDRVERFLENLSKEGMIRTETRTATRTPTRTGVTVISLCNYGKFNSTEDRYEDSNKDRGKDTDKDTDKDESKNTKNERNKETTPIPPKGFEEFWEAYPKKVGKGAAEKIWQRLKPSEELRKKILEAIKAQSQSDQWKKDGGQFIPNPATWLNQRRWEDCLQKTQQPKLSFFNQGQ